MSLLIYSHTSSSRLRYICNFIFQEQLGIAYKLTIDSEAFIIHQGPKINYSETSLSSNEFHLAPHQLLFEKSIHSQSIECFQWNNNIAFFKSNTGDYGFDIFAASFYLLTRYEEYLPHTKDMYGRYPHTSSLAFREGFLNKPIVQIWVSFFAKTLRSTFADITFKSSLFRCIPTYDIDIAYSYKGKGLLRNIGGFLKSPSVERLSVLTGLQKDPYDVYLYLNGLHSKHTLSPIYFFLVATSRGEFDKNISPYSHLMWRLFKQHAKKYSIGIHPSWNSYGNVASIRKEKKILETATEKAITQSRQHYIRFNLPHSFEQLLDAGITDDYSMGFGSINGFRASVADSFNWYDLSKETTTILRIHPFCWMDANSYYEQKQDAATTFSEIDYYYQQCKAVNGQFITIVHNNFLGTDALFNGWREMYEKFISQLP
ncbi:MAG: hypothetical protein WEA59_09585 [Ferruginibacter sp.]